MLETRGFVSGAWIDDRLCFLWTFRYKGVDIGGGKGEQESTQKRLGFSLGVGLAACGLVLGQSRVKR